MHGLHRSVGGATVVDCASHTVAGTFTAAVVAELALLKFACVGAIALLLFLLEIPALSHANGVLGGCECIPYSIAKTPLLN